MMICNFNYSNGVVEILPSADITINTETTGQNDTFYEISSEYKGIEPIAFDLCKKDGSELSVFEIRKLSRWIQQMHSGYRQLQFKAFTCSNLVLYAKCTDIRELAVGGHVYGYRVHLTPNKICPTTKDVTYTIDMDTSKKECDYLDMNDEIKQSIPHLKITIKENCNFSIYNAFTNRTFQINHCISGETITVNADTLYMTSSVRGINVMNSFNGNWFFIQNTLNNQVNRLTIQGKANIEITTKFSRKVGA